MPDESCRTCGGELVKCSLCAECRKVTQRICRICHIKTREQLHLQCFTEPILVNSSQNLLFEHKKSGMHVSSHKKKTGLIISILASVLIGFLVIGSAISDNLDKPSTAGAIPPSEKVNPIHSTTISNPITPQRYENCLAISDGKTMSVKCPTTYGNAYNVVLEIPQNLISELHQKIFSLRGLSITENLNSILMQYEKKWYVTNLVGN